MNTLLPRLRRARRGFSLLELIVVIAIMAIMVAIGTGSYASFQASARSNAALALTDRVINSEVALSRAYKTYSAAPSDMRGLDPTTTFVGVGAASTAGQVSLSMTTSGYLLIATPVTGSECVLRRVEPLINGGRATTIRDLTPQACTSSRAAVSGDVVLTTSTAVRAPS